MYLMTYGFRSGWYWQQWEQVHSWRRVGGVGGVHDRVLGYLCGMESGGSCSIQVRRFR